MTDYADRACARCGRALYTEAELGRLEEDPDYLPESALTHVELPEGWCCWECLSLEEQRTEESQCARCGAEGYDPDSGEEQMDGWVTPRWRPGEPNLYLCPDCQTAEETDEAVEGFLASVRRGQEKAAAEGRDYPADLAATAAYQRALLLRRARERTALEQRLDEEPEP